MAISFEKYVRITSGVVGNVGVRQRELILRVFTENALVSPDEALEFTSLDDVKAFFGMESAEYLRAQFYFAWVSKQATRARKISFARYAPEGTAPSVYGGGDAKSLSAIKAAGGALSINLGGTVFPTTDIDLSAADSLAAVAATVQTAIRALSGSFSDATVAYDASSRRFVLALPSGGAATIGVEESPLAAALDFTRENGALFITGSEPRSAAETVSDSAELTNNFGAFLFLADLDDEDIAAVAAWTDAQNVKFLYLVPVRTRSEAEAKFAALAGFSGVAVTLLYAGADTGYPEMCPAVVLAATDYTRRNSTCNYMFQQFNLQPSVTTTAQSDALDKARCNYYGVTQTAGQYLAFYQRGLLMGGSSAPTDMNAYANEIWLKDLAGTQIMSLLLSLQKVSANARGRSQIINILLPVVDAALHNGAISVGKPLTETQKAFITEETGDADAWRQVADKGFWLDCSILTEVTEDGRTEYYARYILIYSKDDVIRRVEGSHELI
ncbi:MAG: DUF3383 domain-containing protein [Zoogloeaceae bacterium]|jgi:hypothetical protein|nr:DUF3383 domain-containing protein [Zoogloeaceae bacterium]